MKINKLIFFVVLCFMVGTVSAQKTWEKPLQRWSKEDATKILTTSSWVQTYQSPEGLASTAAQEIARDQAEQNLRRQTNVGSANRNLAPPPVVIRLHSALPVRQALVRLQQIEVGYDKWDEKRRAEFDETTKNILTCPLCQKYYVVTMTKFTNASRQEVEDGLFQTMKFEDLKGHVWLTNEKGEKRELAGFTPPAGAGDMAVFFFLRKDDKSNDLLTAQSKDFKFVFDSSILSESNNAYAKLLPRNFEFKVSKITIGDKLEF